jgi:endonuclease YncB( thermonuclease family)
VLAISYEGTATTLSLHPQQPLKWSCMIESVAFCLIVAVSDGDTLKARCGELGDYEQVIVRLAEIDAPEKGQPFGRRSKEALADLCFKTYARIEPITTDRYGRTVARVHCGGEDASAKQVERGMAWFFVRYGTDPAVKALEEAARTQRRGLWSDTTPVAPWVWRQRTKSPTSSAGRPSSPTD